MGLTKNSTGRVLLQNEIEEIKQRCDYVVAVAGNPNVRKINYI